MSFEARWTTVGRLEQPAQRTEQSSNTSQTHESLWHDAVTLRHIAQVWTRPCSPCAINKYYWLESIHFQAHSLNGHRTIKNATHSTFPTSKAAAPFFAYARTWRLAYRQFGCRSPRAHARTHAHTQLQFRTSDSHLVRPFLRHLEHS
jgi:hypothetical protein